MGDGISENTIQKLRRLRDEKQQLAAAALACADELEAELKARYFHRGEIMHPALQHKFDGDMQPVLLVRKLALGK